MADYIINVGVEVEDSALNALETRINSLKEKHIKLGVELGNTKQLTKNAQTAVKTISKATAKAAKNTPVIKGSNLVEQMVDPEKALKSMANTASKLSKYQGKLDLGEVKLSVNQGIMGELDGLLAKLNEIKSTAKNMGSIKLTVGDNIKTKDGKIVVGETTSSSNTWFLKRTIKVEFYQKHVGVEEQDCTTKVVRRLYQIGKNMIMTQEH